MNTVRTRLTSTIACIAFVLLSLSAGFIGSRFPPGSWYAQLDKPWFTPPNWVFGPVWTLLYLIMGVAAWLVWRQASVQQARWAMLAFGVQLGLNAAWSYLFFGRQDIALAFFELCLLWAAILLTIVLFARHSRLAAAMMLPYLGWVSFAAVLNFALWRLNASG